MKLFGTKSKSRKEIGEGHIINDRNIFYLRISDKIACRQLCQHWEGKTLPEVSLKI